MDLTKMIRGEIDAALERGEVIRKPWLVQRIVGARAPAEGPDADFYTASAHYAVNDATGREVRRLERKEAAADDSQTLLPGYEHVQRQYAVIREKEPCIVPTHLLSVEELRAKARELRSMAAGLEAHADELDRYADERASVQRTGE